jgi:hypothetical protein
VLVHCPLLGGIAFGDVGLLVLSFGGVSVTATRNLSLQRAFFFFCNSFFCCVHPYYH